MANNNEKIYLLTDGCAWELNKQTGNEHPHSIEVVDLETGAIRYIRSGSRIAFIDGQITDIRSQKAYNESKRNMSCNPKSKPHRAKRKKESKR